MAQKKRAVAVQVRCPWPKEDPLYLAYHDEEWGVPERDDQRLFEKLILDGFQAGLSWITILRKRQAFEDAFEGFDPQAMATWKPSRVEKLMRNAGIVRNRAKIEGSIASAKAYLQVQEEQGFSRFLWSFVGGTTLHNGFKQSKQVPAQTRESEAMSKALRLKGFKFVGPTICYAFMQATGMVNDHLTTCFRYAPIKKADAQASR